MKLRLIGYLISDFVNKEIRLFILWLGCSGSMWLDKKLWSHPILETVHLF